ncbi:MAG: hypothetical protein C0405_12745, partial [Desulfovibrio sp.]|nr:hypothetical protein [Desulfovibrio sp.]
MAGIGLWLDKRRELMPDKEALVDRDRRLTYAQLNQRVNGLAQGLADLGLKQGDRLAMLSMNRAEFVEVMMACAKLGLILVPLNWRLTASELGFIIGDSGAKALIFDPALQALAEQVKDSATIERLVALGEKEALGAPSYEALLRAQAAPPEVRGIGLDTPHIIMYTAG